MDDFMIHLKGNEYFHHSLLKTAIKVKRGYPN